MFCQHMQKKKLYASLILNKLIAKVAVLSKAINFYCLTIAVNSWLLRIIFGKYATLSAI